jgi:hypothetical protein
MIASPARKTPHARATYRAARRNAVRKARGLSSWRAVVAATANQRAGIDARAVVANGAREVAARAFIEARGKGYRAACAVASAMLDYYRGLTGQTRPVRRIIRDLETQVRVAA